VNRLCVDRLLGVFFMFCSADQEPATVERNERIHAHLRKFLDACGDDYVNLQQEQLLALERQFRPDGAFARLMHADELLTALPAFLSPVWLLPHRLDRKVQISLSSKLVHWVCTKRLVDFRAHREDLILFRRAQDAASQRGP
jgi:hypothetical protein